MAIGRTSNIAGLGLDKIGVHIVNGKVLVDEREQTNLPHIYGLGDVATGKEILEYIVFKMVFFLSYDVKMLSSIQLAINSITLTRKSSRIFEQTSHYRLHL